MEIKKYFYLLVLFCLSGCATVSPKAEKVVPQQTSVEKLILQADTFLKQKNFKQAFILYSEAQKETKDRKVFLGLQLKKAQTQLEMKNYPAALAALGPMPELPATLHDCKKLVMASRILQKMKGKPEHIESLLEVALDNSIEGEDVIPFKASGYAELGRVYVANKKTARAVKCFEYAARLYDMAGDKENAVICRNIMEYLR